MKVLVIMTGGTIGSKSSGNVIDVQSNSYHIIEKYNREYPNRIEFETIQPLNVLSENFTLENLQTLSNTLLSVDTSQYDGVIVTHGSDTLCYTSACLGMLTRHFNIPVVMVASNYELDNPLANGLDNFHGAVKLIESHMVRGCFVVWKDSLTNRVNVHIGTRLRECDSFTDNFQTFGGVPFAEIVNDNIILNGSELNPTIEEINHKRSPLCSEVDFTKKTLLIKTYTGLDFSNFNTADVSSIVIYLYHSGTACTIGDNTSLLKFIDRNPNKSIYVASLKFSKERYSTANEILNCGIIPMYNISIESAYVKALLLTNLNLPNDEILFFENLSIERV